MTSRYLKAIKKLLKAYHKKFDAFGNEKKSTKKRKKRKNGRHWINNTCYTDNHNYYCSKNL